MTVSTSSVFYIHWFSGILDLPGGVVTDLCVALDVSAAHNWKRLVEHVPDYTQMDIMELSNLAQQVFRVLLHIYRLKCWIL